MVTASTQLLCAVTASTDSRTGDQSRRSAYEYEAPRAGSRYWRRTPGALTNKIESYLAYDNRTRLDYQSAAFCRLSIKFGSGVISSVGQRAPASSARRANSWWDNFLLAQSGLLSPALLWERCQTSWSCLWRSRHGPYGWRNYPLVCRPAELVTADALCLLVSVDRSLTIHNRVRG